MNLLFQADGWAAALFHGWRGAVTASGRAHETIYSIRAKNRSRRVDFFPPEDSVSAKAVIASCHSTKQVSTPGARKRDAPRNEISFSLSRAFSH